MPLYHPEAVAYEVLDVDQSHLGVLYFDYFPRDGKSQGAWCGNYVEPVSYTHLNKAVIRFIDRVILVTLSRDVYKRQA